MLVMVRPVGYNETTTIRVRSLCRCRCGLAGRCRDDTQCRENSERSDQDRYSDQTSREQSQEQDPGNPTGSELDPDSYPDQTWLCRAEGSEEDCSGRGVCVCGKCVCDQSNLGTVHGKYCEMDDFSCPYQQGLLCGGKHTQTHTHTHRHTQTQTDTYTHTQTLHTHTHTHTQRHTEGGKRMGWMTLDFCCVVPSGRGVCVLGECLCAESWAGEICEIGRAHV